MPRVLSIVFIAFLALMSLDVFEEKLEVWQTLLRLFIHNIPALILLVVLIISWKREIVGGITFILIGILYIIFAFSRADNWQMALLWILQISGAAFVIGGFFIANWVKKGGIIVNFISGYQSNNILSLAAAG